MQCQAASSDLGDKMFVAMSQVRACFNCSKVGVRGADSVAHSAIGGNLQEGLHHLQERATTLSALSRAETGIGFQLFSCSSSELSCISVLSAQCNTRCGK